MTGTFPSAAFSRELIAGLALHGVRDYVLCPGSRSGPLAHALAAAARPDRPENAPEIELHVRIDERAAGFLALGIAKARAAAGEAAPVAIVTTSGTAVGNLMPAVMEAHHSGVPLLLLTADRPGELKGVGANQTTDQVGLFDSFVRWSVESAAPTEREGDGRAARMAARAVDAAMGTESEHDTLPGKGPVHLNLDFRAPLQDDGGPWPVLISHREPEPRGRWRASGIFDAFVGGPAPLPAKRRGIVIAGDGAGDDARRLAETHRWPLLAEPTSGARAGECCIPGYLAFLRSDRGRTVAGEATIVVVVGRPTLTREVQELIGKAKDLRIAAHGARWKEAPRHATRVEETVPDEWFQLAKDAPAPDDVWLGYWQAAPAPRPDPWGADAVAVELAASLAAGDLCVVGSSGSIRALDRVAPAWDPASAPVLIANRGLAGIDGTVSTAMGAALASDRPVTAVMGDVTFLHDVGGLLVGPRERRPDLRIVVVNDGGGRIFGMLEHSGADPANVERVFTTPHGVNLAPIAAAYGASYAEVSDAESLRAALAPAPAGVEIVEVLLPGAGAGADGDERRGA
ncbi:2-succinyl-5-enolpyruvyl-6-hydroxy-3-cyclohexene-1-carboxylic-acid synthase [Demequina capsici]|uniref:2-succinyl-5-enolpyruvyl-6-hydroxy-3-cyclohexene-1-carboxylate synthase n=1 Tax=Demequina capsici TaxID=3075620 RepID=A0AA96FB53_9MICO|nr:2-succinyl-5-enolpyruvyl-6-hydroxy-3-cyclohexene-1-carboxylic-acid synthase [Demequina sp. PMTSA13]WNM27009.1 2-succinyl-5-enolpyruvyl-6-hydroxy-3-cyclohexene-1-carboxylic-acid synthase [Demequina sp. PMTSA13]